MSPIVIFLVLAGLWSVDANKQVAVGMEQLRQEFDDFKLTLEHKHYADIEKLTNQISEQKADNEKYQADIDKLSAQVSEQKTDNEKCKADIDKYMSDTDKLTAQVSEQKSDIETYQVSNRKMEEKVEMLMRQVDDLTRTNVEQQQTQEVFLSGNRNGSTTDAYTGVVAFYARIDGFTGSPTEHTPVPFDIVDLNVGSAYDPTNGDFTAPVDGIYSFSFEFMTASSCGTALTCLDLYVDGVVLSESCSIYPNSVGTAVTVQLTAGQVVKLATNYAFSCEVIDNGSPQNKFSGHLLYQII